MKKIKILNVISDTNIGGAGKCIITYCNNYNKERYEIVVAIPRGSLLKNEIEKTGVKIVEIDGLKDKSLDIPAIKKLKKIIKEENPDIVHTHASLSARIAAKKCKRKIVYTRHCDFPPSKIYRYKFIRFLNGKFNEYYTDKIIATSEMAKKNLVKQGISDEKIITVLNGVDRFEKITDGEKTTLKKKYKIAENEKVVGYLARLEELKGHKYLFDAAKIIKEKTDFKLKYLIMGVGSFENELKKYVDDLEMQNDIIFTGFVSDVQSMLNIIDIQVNASYLSETSNLALIEGMSLGIPTVASIVGGTPNVITTGENGILVEKANPEAMANAIIELLQDVQMFSIMKEKSEEIFEEKFTSTVYADNIEKVYESMVI